MSARKLTGWLGAAAAVWWLWADYQVKLGRGKIEAAIGYGWATIGFTAAHIWIARSGK